MALIDGLLNYWKLDEASGTTVYDSHGTINGSVSGAVTLNQSGKINKSCLFASTTKGSDRIAFTNLGNPAIQSVSLWVKITDATISEQKIFWFGGSANWNIIRGAVDTNKKFFLQIYVDVPNQPIIVSDNAYTQNAWTHIVLIYGSNGMKMYINGVLQSNTNPYTGTGSSPGNNKYLGSGTTQLHSINGYMDEVAFFNKELLLNEVQSLYAGGAGFPYPFEALPTEGFLTITGITAPASAHVGSLINFTGHTKNTGAADTFKVELSGSLTGSTEFSLGAGLTKDIPFSFTMPDANVSITIKTYHLTEEGWVWDVTSTWDVNWWY